MSFTLPPANKNRDIEINVIKICDNLFPREMNRKIEILRVTVESYYLASIGKILMLNINSRLRITSKGVNRSKRWVVYPHHREGSRAFVGSRTTLNSARTQTTCRR